VLFLIRKNAGRVDGSHMGFRSLFVLAKLGFDMREQYNDLLEEPLPDEISRPLLALAARDVIALPQR
jgi:hypothetical protein